MAQADVGVVRVRPARLGGPCAVRHPEHGELVVPAPGAEYRADDPLVRAYPWLFPTDADLARDAAASAPVAIEAPKRRRGL